MAKNGNARKSRTTSVHTVEMHKMAKNDITIYARLNSWYEEPHKRDGGCLRICILTEAEDGHNILFETGLGQLCKKCVRWSTKVRSNYGRRVRVIVVCLSKVGKHKGKRTDRNQDPILKDIERRWVDKSEDVSWLIKKLKEK